MGCLVDFIGGMVALLWVVCLLSVKRQWPSLGGRRRRAEVVDKV